MCILINIYIGDDWMKEQYEEYSKVIKAVSDPSRLKILDILSCGEQCACDILENFEFTQPTLSHHMKILMECALVTSRKEANWTKYSLNISRANQMLHFLMGIITPTKDCICNECNKM